MTLIQAAQEPVSPMEAIVEENSESSDEDDEEIEETEFVPSAWDSQATPTKSALRSPEKSNKVGIIFLNQNFFN